MINSLTRTELRYNVLYLAFFPTHTVISYIHVQAYEIGEWFQEYWFENQYIFVYQLLTPPSCSHGASHEFYKIPIPSSMIGWTFAHASTVCACVCVTICLVTE